MSNSSYLSSLTDAERERLCYHVLPELRDGRRSGEHIVIRSPLRDDDDTPSFNVSLPKGLWKDFGTGEGSDLVTLAVRRWGCDAAEAIAQLRAVLEGNGPKSDFRDVPARSAIPLSSQPAPPVATRRRTALEDPNQASDGVARRYTPSHGAAMLSAEKAPVERKSSSLSAQFWTDAQAKAFNRARTYLHGDPIHPLVQAAMRYDGLRYETLCRFGCGIVTYGRQPYLAFPYPTGVQLYRREQAKKGDVGDGGKVIRCGSNASGVGSKPGSSFFGLDDLSGQTTVLIAKSPREAMLLWQHARYHKFHGVDVIGLATGEQARLSADQVGQLKRLVRGGVRRFVVVLDQDTEQASAVARGLADAVRRATGAEVAEINVSALTGGAHKDVTEALRDEAFAAALDLHGATLFEAGPPAEREPRSPAQRFSLKNPMTMEPVALTFVLEGIAARGKVTVIGGAPGVGKSLFVQYLLQRRDKQTLVPALPGITLYLVGMDTGEDEVVRRAHKIRGDGLRTIELVDDAEYVPFMSEPAFVNDLVTALRDAGADSLVIDTLADVHGADLNDAALANHTMTAMRQVAERAHVAVIVITHTRKSGQGKPQLSVSDIADSRVFASKADTVIGLMGESLPGGGSVFEVQILKSRLGAAAPPLRLEVQEKDGRIDLVASTALFSHEQEAEAKHASQQARVAEVRRLVGEGKSQQQIADELGISKATVNAICKKAKARVPEPLDEPSPEAPF